MTEDTRKVAPAADRNKEPILKVLRRVLPQSGTVLEIASGTGQHVVHFAKDLPGLTWQPSEPDPEGRASIASWAAHDGATNVLPPVGIDVTAEDWPVKAADAVLCINMIHISPWAATPALMEAAGRLLPRGGPLVLYGPFRREGHAFEPSNQAFDRQLRDRDPEWGIRELGEVEAVAESNGLRLEEVVEMPANNLCVVFRRA